MKLFHWIIAGLLYAVLICYLALPVFSGDDSAVLGFLNDDFFDETMLTGTVCEALRKGEFPLYLKAMDFPEERNLFTIYKLYLHSLLGASLKAFFPWPMWWNAAVIGAVWMSCMAAYWMCLRISDSKVFSWLGGLFFAFGQYTVLQISWGHIPQLLNIFALIAVGALALLFTAPEEKAAETEGEKRENHGVPFSWKVNLALLGVCTVLSTCTYLITGMLLAFIGFILLLSAFPQLNRQKLMLLSFCVMLTALALAPLLVYTVNVDQDLQMYVMGMEEDYIDNSLVSCSDSALFPLSGRRVQLLYPGVILNIFLALVLIIWYIGNIKYKNEASVWLFIAVVLGIIGMGPYWALGESVFVDKQGGYVLAPLGYLLKCSGLIRYWRVPCNVVPLAKAASLLALSFSFNYLSADIKGVFQKKNRFKAACQALIFVLALTLLFVYSSACAAIGRISAGKTAGVSYYPCSEFYVPEWCRFLERQPEGAIVDFPGGYCTNTWQLYCLHGHPACSGKRYESRNFDNNYFLKKTRLLNEVMVKPYAAGRKPDSSGSELPYGVFAPRFGFEDNRPKRLHLDMSKREFTLGVEQGYRALYFAGLRYFILHKANSFWLSPEHGEYVYNNFASWLRRYCGEPVFSDENAEIFKAPPPDEAEGMLEYLDNLN
ncbi:hypothetical protein IJT93_01395 [bacterium]|nr:hypothetical protein [bacterium]